MIVQSSIVKFHILHEYLLACEISTVRTFVIGVNGVNRQRPDMTSWSDIDSDVTPPPPHAPIRINTKHGNLQKHTINQSAREAWYFYNVNYSL